MKQEILKDWITNTWLQLKNSVWRRIDERNKTFTTKGYDEWWFDNFDRLRNWRKDFPWGIYSETEELTYVDTDMVKEKTSTTTYVKLKTELKPKVNHFNGAVMPWARACIMSNLPFRHYGTFEVIAKVHPAKGVWHAPLWFVAATAAGSEDPYAVLPEPDVAEVYSKVDRNKFKVKSNLHFGTDYSENSKRIGARTHYIPNFTGRWVSYGMVWKADRIEFYYDWHLYRVVTDLQALERLKHGVYPIIGVGVNVGQPHDGSEMDVKSFNYWRGLNKS